MGVTSNDAEELRGLCGCLPRGESVLEPRGAYNEPGRGRRFTPLPPARTPTLSPVVAYRRVGELRGFQRDCSMDIGRDCWFHNCCCCCCLGRGELALGEGDGDGDGGHKRASVASPPRLGDDGRGVGELGGEEVRFICPSVGTSVIDGVAIIGTEGP